MWPGRLYTALVYDHLNKRLAIMGGSTSGNSLNDFWTADITSLFPPTTSAPTISPTPAPTYPDWLTSCPKIFDIEIGLTTREGDPVPVPTIIRMVYSDTPMGQQEQGTNAIFANLDKFTKYVIKGIKETCDNQQGSTGRRRLLSMPAVPVVPVVPWMELIDVMVPLMAFDERSVCDKALMRAYTMRALDERTKVCALKREVYMMLGTLGVNQTMPIGYYYDDTPIYERLFTYRDELMHATTQLLSGAVNTWNEAWAYVPPPVPPVPVPFPFPSPLENVHGLVTRRRLLTFSDDATAVEQAIEDATIEIEKCLNCELLDDIISAVNGSFHLAVEQYDHIQHPPRPLSIDAHSNAHINGWRTMDVNDILPYRIGAMLRDIRFTRDMIRTCDMEETMMAQATETEIDDGLIYACLCCVLILLFLIPLAMMITAVPWLILVLGIGMVFIAFSVFTYTAYDVPLTCDFPYPAIPSQLFADVQNLIERWHPGCMCSYFPELIIGDTPCDSSCSQTVYSWHPCRSVVNNFGLLGGVEYIISYFISGVFELQLASSPLSPLDRTVHSCWVFFSAVNAPLLIAAFALYLYVMNMILNIWMRASLIAIKTIVSPQTPLVKTKIE